MFVDGGQVALLFVEDLELEEGSEIVWTGEEEFEHAIRRAHPCFYSFGEKGKKGVEDANSFKRARTLVRLLFHHRRVRVSITRLLPLPKSLKKERKKKNSKMSDIQLNPPLRIQPTTAKSISAKSANARVSQFLDDYQERHVSARTQGDKTIVAQLQKLTNALAQEQAIRKTK